MSATLVLLALIAAAVAGIRSGQTEARAGNAGSNSGHQASLQRFSLADLVDRAGSIFRGTVVSLEPGTIEVGGGSLPTVTYVLRVDHSFKGDFESKDGVMFAEVTMLGSPKVEVQEHAGNFKKLNKLPAPTLLNIGSDYLLFLTPKSEVGLTAPVGLGQGSFEVFQQDKTEFVKNEYNNVGLFDGPVKYSELANKIRKGGK